MTRLQGLVPRAILNNSLKKCYLIKYTNISINFYHKMYIKHKVYKFFMIHFPSCKYADIYNAFVILISTALCFSRNSSKIV